MLRSCVAALASVLLVGACGGGSAGTAPSSTAVRLPPAGQTTSPGSSAASASAATLPASVDAGVGALLIGGVLERFGVTGCSLSPRTDASTGVTTNLEVTGDDGSGGNISITQKQANVGGGLTITETITFFKANRVAEAMRFEVGGVWRSLSEPNASGPLLSLKDGELRGAGLFGPPGVAAGDPALKDGSLIARCP